MSTILLEGPAQDDHILDDPVVEAPEQHVSETALKAPEIPVGIVALHDLGIVQVLPPVTEAQEPVESKKASPEGINQRTVNDLHAILSDDPDPEPKAAARARLEKGTITERALAFSLDILIGYKYDNPVYNDITPPDTRSTTGLRSTELAVMDPENSFLKRANKHKYRDERKLSDVIYSDISGLAYGAENRAKAGNVNSKYFERDSELTRYAVNLVLDLAEQLDAEILYKVIGSVPNLSHYFSRPERLYRSLEKVLEKSDQPSAADAFLCAHLWYEHNRLELKISGKGPQSIEPGDADHLHKRDLENQRLLQDILARANKSRGYTANELNAIGRPDQIKEEDFQAMHRLRDKLPNWTAAGDLPTMRKYIVENPKALALVDNSEGSAVLTSLTRLASNDLALDGRLMRQDTEKLATAEEAFRKFIDFVDGIQDAEKQSLIIESTSNMGAIVFGDIDEKNGGRIYHPERLTWILDNAPDLLATGNASEYIHGLSWAMRPSDSFIEKYGELSDEQVWEYIQEAVLILDDLPKDSRTYALLTEELSYNYHRSSEFVDALLTGKAQAMVEAIRQLDENSPNWFGELHGKDNIFRPYARIWVDQALGDEPPNEGFESLKNFLSELKSYTDLSPELQKMVTELIVQTSLANGFEPYRVIFKPENRQVLELFAKLNLANPFMRGFGLLEDRLDSLRPIAKDLSNHPLMTILGTEAAKGIGSFAKDILTADEPLKYADALYQSAKIFGQNSSEELVDMIYAVYKGGKALEVQDEELKKIVGEGGQPGIDKLTAHLNKFKEQVIAGDIDLESLEHSRLYLAYFKALTRYEVSQWGSHYDDRLLLQIKFQAENPDRKRFSLIDDEAYKPSEVVQVAELDQEKVQAFKITKDGEDQFWELLDDLSTANDIVNNHPEMVADIVSDVLMKISTHQSRLEQGRVRLAEKLETVPEEKSAKLRQNLEELDAEIAELAQIDEATLINPTLFMRNVSVIGRYKDMHGSIRKMLFVAALTKYPEENERVSQLARGGLDGPTINEFQEVADLVQHVTNQETWGEVFKNFGLYKSLDQILNVNAINENIQRSLNIGNAGTRSMQFMPTRGILMELSGHIGDACWASKYESIAGQFPEFTSVIMTQKPGTKDARLVGSAFLIEANDKDGNPVLVIRGLNPIQNVIEQLDPKDFFDQFSTYAREIAQKRGMKLAVVIDDHCGGSATNRPALYEYLSKQLKPQAKPVELAGYPETTFNGYNIQGNTFLI